ncbi:MAG TPA: cyclic nucleotide-binding domain-containing protein [Coriobacteriia bacterium]|nr:cyclic nucleotide-binding domain-containing protein [Coriobacteriia bacterium]
MERISSAVLGCDEGELVYQQGDTGNVMYVIRSGQVRISRADSHGEILLATLSAGDFFGEMSLISGGRRSATVIAETPVELEVITRSAFLEHVKDPLAIRVMQGLSERLRRVDSLLEYLHIEQYRVRQDAHDRVYNRLAALSRLVEIAGHEHGFISDDDEEPISLEIIAADIRETVTELQHILSDRSSVDQAPTVDHDAVMAKLLGVCESQGDIWQMDVRLDCPRLLPPLPQAMCWDLECIVEEAITNAAKHGEASLVRVSIDVSESGSREVHHVELTIVDDGRGLHRVPDLSELPEHSKGLRGMHSRVQSYGGTLALDSSAEATILSVLVPVQVQ